VPTYTTTAAYEAPPRVIYRKFGYVCEIITSQRYCRVGVQCDENGNRLKKNRFVHKTMFRVKINCYFGRKRTNSLALVVKAI
jgi:hypothetical protein